MAEGEDQLVYFPLLKVPESGWLARQLLYWDRLLVPTPLDVAERADDNFDDFTRELMARNLVAYVFPEDHPDVVHNVSNAFATSIQNIDLDSRLRSMKLDQIFGLHRGKTTGAMLDHLDSLGLAARGRDGWWVVEQMTAHEYMAAVSGAIATGLGASAVTDSEIAVAAVTGVGAARVELLEEALPAPETFDFAVLEELRGHREELFEFRRETELYAHAVANAQGDQADRWRNEYRDRVANAERALNAYLAPRARVGRLVRGPFGSLIAGRAGALVEAMQTFSEFMRGTRAPERSFSYAARVRTTIRA